MSSVFSVPELAIGIAVGGAAGAAFEPKLEIPKQTAWAANPQRLPDLGLIAALVAGGKVSITDGQNMAARLGYDTGPFDSLVWLAQNRLDFAQVLRLWRRFSDLSNSAAIFPDALVTRTLAHEQLDWDYEPFLTALKTAELPGIGDIAYSVVRGYLPTNIKLPVPPPSTSTYVPRFPQSKLLADTLAAELGFDQEMLRLMIARSGLSMAPVMAANAYFRTAAKDLLDAAGGTLTSSGLGMIHTMADDDYMLAISEGDLRTEWHEAVRNTARQLPTAGEYAELQLRGWITEAERRALAQQHGMTDGNSDLLYKLHRRPLTPHAIKQALARGAKFNPQAGEIQDPYTASVHQANLGPEWYEMGVALQGSYPSLFQTNRLVTAGTITPDVGQLWLQRSGMADEVVTEIFKAWSGGTTASADKHAVKAENQLWTTTHKSYVAEEITDATATAALIAAGVAAATVPAILALWAHERSLIRKQLSPAQIKKAFTTSTINPATGAAWTQAEATAALLARGYDQNDATVLLTE